MYKSAPTAARAAFPLRPHWPTADAFRLPHQVTSHNDDQVGFQRVRKLRVQKFVMGTKNEERCKFFTEGPDPSRDLFVFRVSPIAKEEDIKSYLTEGGIAVRALSKRSAAQKLALGGEGVGCQSIVTEGPLAGGSESAEIPTLIRIPSTIFALYLKTLAQVKMGNASMAQDTVDVLQREVYKCRFADYYCCAVFGQDSMRSGLCSRININLEVWMDSVLAG
ncbi:hypothetical protein CAPTEDRAFT_215683 [Capitella teleta]|uniref:Uncharacterized protein n=1 Tax=Capitella teleta TaxID=283909 RepID=R7TK91_CAPTE|nr:hypothetical protein CAPTEDRAFT_215683 [Capitella teleta]|eukprot:ELT93897.1 hypothetical protein CAPTEDRAFT_215683 [Capitella teleta]